MRTKEIATVAIAGLVSLGALLFVEHSDPLPASSMPTDSEAQRSSTFHDDASLLELSPPAPTAEPPAIVAAGEEAPSAESSPEPPVAEPVEDEPIVPAAPVSPAEITGADLVETGEGPSVVGILPDDEGPLLETGPSVGDDFADSFAEAVEKATADLGPDPAPAPRTTADGEGGEDGLASIIEETATGFWLREAKLNDVFQHLAQLGNHQFFHNAELEGPNFVVTGQLMDDDPIRQMEELALMYGVTIHKKGNTVYALNSAQLATLPTEPFRYQLKYLRPSDIEQIKLILQPFLTPGSGIIEYESKTNTLIVMDNERKLDALAMFLEQIDLPKQQIAIETRILRVSSNAKNQIGVDWSSVLGDQGLSIGASSSLNALFNLPDLETATRVVTAAGEGASLAIAENNREFGVSDTFTRESNEANLVLSPVQLSVVLRALNAGGLAQQESSPTLITEDNEEGLISIIDRVPIITATISETSAGQNVTEDVRYTIDESDPVGDPTLTREIGVSVAVTPTILPDNTIRMALRPRSAQIVDFIQGQTGNLYPRVNESTVTTTARVPNGHSLLIGGFYEESTNDRSNKVPVLGDIPAVNLLFKNKSTEKQNTSLVFIVTPKLYRPDTFGTESISHEIHESHLLPSNYDYPDPQNPGYGYKPDLKNAVNNGFRKYEPDPPSNLLHPAHPYNLPESQPVHGKTGSEEPNFDLHPDPYANPSVTVRPANRKNGNGGLLGQLFGGNKAKKN